jgi:FkbM family methyltransferase
VVEGLEVPGLATNWKTRVIGCLLGLRPGVFVDVGANLGQTLLDLRLADGDRHYFGFEPNPTCVYYLQRLIELNRFGETSKVIGAGVSDVHKVARLHLANDEPADEAATFHADLRPHASAGRVIYAPALHLDDAWPSLCELPVGIVKIDVEGSELEVLRGICNILARDRPFILCEVLPAARGTSLEATRSRHGAIEAFLGTVGYRILHLIRNASGDLAGAEAVDRFELAYWSPESSHAHDYLMVGSEAVEEVTAALRDVVAA